MAETRRSSQFLCGKLFIGGHLHGFRSDKRLNIVSNRDELLDWTVVECIDHSMACGLSLDADYRRVIVV